MRAREAGASGGAQTEKETRQNYGEQKVEVGTLPKNSFEGGDGEKPAAALAALPATALLSRAVVFPLVLACVRVFSFQILLYIASIALNRLTPRKTPVERAKCVPLCVFSFLISTALTGSPK